jgi:hypothetical protein
VCEPPSTPSASERGPTGGVVGIGQPSEHPRWHDDPSRAMRDESREGEEIANPPTDIACLQGLLPCEDPVSR